MEEAVWGNPNQNVSTSHEVSDSNSTLKTYQRKGSTSVWSKTKSVLNGMFTALAAIGWAITLLLIWDAFFNDTKIIEYLLIGY